MRRGGMDGRGKLYEEREGDLEKGDLPNQGSRTPHVSINHREAPGSRS